MKKQIFALLGLIFFGVFNAYTAVKTWDGGGGDNNWQTAANWVNNVAPVANDDLVFPTTAAQFSTNNNFFLLTSFNSITFEGGTYAIGGNPFRLTGGMTVNGGTQAVNTSISLSGGQTFTGGQTSVTTIAILSISGSGLTLDGSGSFAIGLVSGSGAIHKNGLGASLLAAAASYNGAINLNDGVFIVDASVPNSTVTINSPTTTGGTLGFSGFGGTGTVGTVNVTQGAISAGTLTSPTGILNTGSLNFTANGNYLCKIGGTTAGTDGHDQLNVTGSVNLNNARLVPLPWGTFRPAIGNSFTILKNDGTDAVNGTFLNAPEGAVFSGALNTAFRITYHGGDGNDIVITRVNRAPFDFDGDGKTDLAAFHPADGTWNGVLSGNSANFSQGWGFGTDKIAPADFDGDNKTDLAIYRNGVWWILNSATSSVSTTQFGLAGDIPIPNDFDGDGRADIAVWRPSDGVWYELRSLGNQFFAQGFGLSGDKPVVGDFDGDGIGDLAIYRPLEGVWYLFQSADNSYKVFPFGIPSDVPCAADYDGDGKTDACVFRGTADANQPDFYILKSSDSTALFISWGLPDDLPLLGDFDGDGKADIGIFRGSSHDWYWLRSSNLAVGYSNFGQTGDKPIPSAFVP